MQRLTKVGLLLSAVILLSGCAALDLRPLDLRRPIPESASSSINNIGVTSTFGDAFNLTGRLSLLDNRSAFYVEEWNIPDASIQIAVNYLQSTGKYKAVSLGSGFKDYESGNSMFAESCCFSLGSDFKDYESMYAAAESQGIDTIVTIDPVHHEDAPDFIAGYGLYRMSIFGVIIRECVYTLFVVQAYDVKSKKKLGWQWGFNQWQGISCYGKDSDIPWHGVKEWREIKNQFSSQELDILRKNVLANLGNSIPFALRKLKLGQ